MKSLKTIMLLLSFALLSKGVVAQPGQEEIQIIQNIYGMEKRDMVKASMQLGAADAAKFWPVYDAYETKRQELGRERISLMSEYINNYPNFMDSNTKDIANAKANALATKVFKNDMAFDKLHKAYYKKIKKAISPLKAAQFIQIETYLQNAVRLSVAKELPFISEFKK